MRELQCGVLQASLNGVLVTMAIVERREAGEGLNDASWPAAWTSCARC